MENNGHDSGVVANVFYKAFLFSLVSSSLQRARSWPKMPLLTLLTTLLAALSSNAAILPRQAGCVTQSQPDLIAAQYPNEVTGTINGTFAVIPIPYAQARALVPSQFKILTRAYETLMPGLNGAYPVAKHCSLPFFLLCFLPRHAPTLSGRYY